MEQFDDTLDDVVVGERDFKMKVGKFQLVWTNGIVNLCFLLLFVTFQINACEMLQRREYRSSFNGLILFLLATIMEFCLVIEPPQLMVWIPFWRHSVRRSIFLCIVSVNSLYGNFLLGFVSLLFSFVVLVSPIVTGGTGVAAPILNYEAVFDASEQAPASYRDKAPEQTNKKKGKPRLGESYQSITTEDFH